MTLTGERHRAWCAIVLSCMAAIGLAACAATATGAYLPSGISLRPYRTYAWGPASARTTGDPRLDNNEIFDAHVRRQIDNHLRRHGFARTAESALPDLLVHYHAAVSQKVDVRELDQTGTQQHNEQDAPSTVYDEGTLVVELVDRQTLQLVWRGWVEGRIGGVADDQRLMERQVDDAVDRIFKRLPNGAF